MTDKHILFPPLPDIFLGLGPYDDTVMRFLVDCYQNGNNAITTDKPNEFGESDVELKSKTESNTDGASKPLTSNL